MKKSLIFIAVACSVFYLGDVVFGWMVDGIMQRSEFRFARLYTGRLQGDVIVLGNSRAVNGFCAPRLTELTSVRWVNLGYNGMAPPLVEAIMLDYIDRYPAPRAVVLEVSNIMQGNDSIRESRLFADKSKRLAELDVRENGWMGFIAAHLRTFAANGEMLLRCLYYVGRSDQTWVNEGQLALKDAERLRIEAGRRLEGAIVPGSVVAYKRLIHELRQRNIPVLCVVTPYLLTEKDQRYAQTWLDMLRDTEDNGVRYINLVNAIKEPNMYADPSHLNSAGSLAFTEILTNVISLP